MDKKFKIVAKRDDRMLADFVNFYNRYKHPRVSIHLCIFGICFILIPLGGGNIVASIIMYILGAIFLSMAFFRQYIAVFKMKKQDSAYGIEVTYIFGKNDLSVYRGEELEKTVGGYKSIHTFCSDEKNYYIGMNEDELYLLPRRAFVEGDADEFETFIAMKSRVECKWMPIKLKNKLRKLRTYMKEKDREHDEKIALIQEQKKKEKERKKRAKE